MNKETYIVVFNSKNHAYFLESILKKLRIHTLLIQVPNYLSNRCSLGMIIKEKNELQIALESIKSNSLDVYRIYEKSYSKENGELIYKVIS